MRERTLDEISRHRHPILLDPEKYRVISLEFKENYEEGNSFLQITICRADTGERRTLRFCGVSFPEPPLTSLRDATGLYIMDTSHLGWDAAQSIEVGDWDGGPPLFWACSAEDLSGSV